jgi:hypothetical protein
MSIFSSFSAIAVLLSVLGQHKGGDGLGSTAAAFVFAG